MSTDKWCFKQTANLLSLGTHVCLGEVSRKSWLHDFAINNNGGSVPVIFISLTYTRYAGKQFLSMQKNVKSPNGKLEERRQFLCPITFSRKSFVLFLLGFMISFP